MTFDLTTYLSRCQAQVEPRLRHLIEREQGSPAVLREAMAYSLLAPGKRLRPGLVFMAAQAAGGTDEQSLPAACAVEMIHTYSLVHDDLPAMDDDDLRRGLPTCHKKYGEALAILAGDALLTLAFQTLAESYPPGAAAGCTLELARASGLSGMVGGQVEDIGWERSCEDGAADSTASRAARNDTLFPRTQAPHSLEALEHIHRLKTGALFIGCLRLGVWAVQGERSSGPDPKLLERLERFGACFGLVFQITDDLLDVQGTAAATGKQVNKDAAKGKLTYPSLLGVEESRRRAAQLVQEALDHVTPLGQAAAPLAALMEFVLARNR